MKLLYNNDTNDGDAGGDGDDDGGGDGVGGGPRAQLFIKTVAYAR